MKKIAVVVSHPIQHFCPQYHSWANINGIELKVFFASNFGISSYEDKNFGITIKWDNLNLDFPHLFLPNSNERKVDSSIDCMEIISELDIFNPDLIIVYGYAQKLQRRVISWARKNSIKIAMISDSELRGKRSLLKRLVKKLYLPVLFKKINIFLTVGDANEEYYRSYGVKDTSFVRTFFPIDRKSFNEKRLMKNILRENLREKLNIPNNHIVLLMVGKLVDWKRQIDLVLFSNRIQGHLVDLTIILVGTGADQDKLKKITLKNGAGGVIFSGFIQPYDLIDYYYASDIYVHCSEIEPHSLAISEAIYSGLPVIVSDKCGSYGPSDDVRPGLNGFVYECGNVDSLSKVIFKLIESRNMILNMSSESLIISNYNQDLAHIKAIQQAEALLLMLN